MECDPILPPCIVIIRLGLKLFTTVQTDCIKIRFVTPLRPVIKQRRPATKIKTPFHLEAAVIDPPRLLPSDVLARQPNPAV